MRIESGGERPRENRSREEILLRILETPPAERARRLEELCAGDDELEAEISRILELTGDAALALGLLTSGPDEILPVEESAPPRAIGPYSILRKLGDGGMGTVFLAEQGEPLHRQVALKVIRHGMARTAEVLARFRLELKLLAGMSHDGIAKVFDAGSTPAGEPYFAMELVDGERITEYADSRSLSTGARLRLFLQVARAIEYAHSQRVVHRDLKPSNVLVSEQGGEPRAKVIDFGIAKALDAGASGAFTTLTGRRFLGTLCYASPEQLFGTERSDERTDIYSLGATLFELIVGEPPFSGKDDVDLFQRRMSAPVPSLRRFDRKVSVDLDTVVAKAMATDPSNRYATVGDFALDIARILEGRPIEARRPSVPRRVFRFAGRHRRAVVASALAIAACAAIAVPIAYRLASEIESRANEVRDGERKLARVRYLGDLIEAGKAADEGERERARDLVAARAWDEATAAFRGFELYYLGRRLHLDVPALELSPNALSRWLFLPDGRSIARIDESFGSEPSVVSSLELDGERFGSLRWSRPVDVRACEFTLDPDRTLIELASCSSRWVHEVDVETGEVRFHDPKRQATAISYSPNGRLLAMASGAPIMHISRVGDSVPFARWEADEKAWGAARQGFTGDGRRFVTLNGDSLRVWRIPTGEEIDRLARPLEELPLLASVTLQPVPTDLAIAGDRIVVAHEAGGISVRSAETLAPLVEASIHEGVVRTIAVAPALNAIASGGDDGTIRISRLEDLAPVATYVTPSNRVEQLAWSLDGKLLASSESDGFGRLWPLDDLRPPVVDLTHSSLFWDAAFAADGSLITEDGEIAFASWDAERARRSGKLASTLSVQGKPWSAPGNVSEMSQLDPRGELAAVSTPRNSVEMLSLAAPGAPESGASAELDPFADPVYGMGFSPDSQLFAASATAFHHPGCDTRLRVWKREPGAKTPATWERILDVESSVASRRIVVLPRADLIVHGGRYGTPVEFRALSSGVLLSSAGDVSFVADMVPSRDSRYLAMLFESGRFELWLIAGIERGRSPPRVLSSTAHPERVQALAFFPNGRELATGTVGGPVRLWRLIEEGGSLELMPSIELSVPAGEVKALATSADGRTLAAVGGALDDSSGWTRIWYGLRDGELDEPERSSR